VGFIIESTAMSDGVLGSLDRDVAKKIASKYDPEKEAEVCGWISKVTGASFSDGLQETLKSGVVICNLLNKIKPGAVTSINTKSMPFAHRENISKYIDACKALGMNKADLFDTQDLYDGKNIVSVITHFYALSGFSKTLGFTGPFCGLGGTFGIPAAGSGPVGGSSAGKKMSIVGSLPLQTSGSHGVDTGSKGPELRRDVVRDPAKKTAYADRPPADDDEALGDLDRDLKKKMASKYDPAKEAEVREWIQTVLKRKLVGDTLQEALMSGVALCDLINVIWPKTIAAEKISLKDTAFFQRVNISTYLDACKAKKMNLVDLFDTQDLYDNKNMPQVINHFYSLSGFASINAPGFSGPFIGVKFAEKNVREFTEEQLRKGKFVMSSQTSGSHGVLEPETEAKLAYQIIKDVDHIKKTHEAAKAKADGLYGKK